MNKPTELFVPAAVAAAVASIASIAVGGAAPPAPSTADAGRSEAAALLDARLDALQRSHDDLAVAHEALAERLASAELAARGSGRLPAEAAPEAPAELDELAAALAGRGAAPAAVGEWIDAELTSRDLERREKRRADVQERLDGMLADRIDELAERLGLAPHQTNQVEGILSSHIADVSSVIADAGSPIEIMQGIGPIREARDTELQTVLTPEQFTAFQKEEGGLAGPGLPFARPGR
ncbi:MAG: hypothetical protein AAFZ87_12630 [Planctomycetota bacterium]